MTPYQHLSTEERFTIREALRAGYNQTEVASNFLNSSAAVMVIV
jgi:hypothetical protein